MRTIVLLIALILAGGMAYIRLAPSDPARWNQALPGEMDFYQRPANVVFEAAGGAGARLVLSDAASPRDILSRLNETAAAAPRTRRLAGTPDEGRITWVTRSAVFGFPDYTTAEIVTDGHIAVVGVFARQRFGRGDFGVNAARLKGWIGQLTP